MAWLETASFAGGKGDLVRYDLVVRLTSYVPEGRTKGGNALGARGLLVLQDGTRVECGATVETMRGRLLDATARDGEPSREAAVQRVRLEFGSGG